MKRILLAASVPLVGCGPRGTLPNTPCPDPPPTVSYVDSTHFTDGGFSQQACVGCTATSCSAYPFDAGVAEVICGTRCTGGRRPAGFDTIALSARDAVGEWLARTAALEAASVPAFRILAHELRAHAAPEVLIACALRSAQQETRHAATMARLARRYGAVAAPVAIAPREVRDLATIAVENAVEGGVREAYGAAVAVDQARSAGDAEVRAAFAAIAPEELGHARLAAAIDAWVHGQLTPAARRRVDEARALARAELAAAVEREPAPELRATLGLPEATRAVELATGPTIPM
jgi:hypothetical protein